MPRPIPFNRPAFVGKEIEYLTDAITSGHASADGKYTRLCQDVIERTLGVSRALLTPSGTHALEMAAILLDTTHGDEVIVPSFTFPSTANAFALRGAHVVFADIRADTLNIDESILPALITPRTKTIAVVHYAGVGCEMEQILGVTGRLGIHVVEDNAHGLFAKYKGRWLGTFGVFAAQSFHETKNVMCGEGGALLVNDPSFVDRAEVVREKGTDRSRFFKGMVSKYSWVDIGSSYALSDLLAAVLFAQLESKDAIQRRRREIWDRYTADLRDWAEDVGASLPVVPPYCEQAYHMFYLLLPDVRARDALIEHLKAREILGVFHYVPLHLSAMGALFGGRRGQCPVAEDVAGRIVRLPFFNDMTGDEQSRVVVAVRSAKW